MSVKTMGLGAGGMGSSHTLIPRTCNSPSLDIVMTGNNGEMWSSVNCPPILSEFVNSASTEASLISQGLI